MVEAQDDALNWNLRCVVAALGCDSSADTFQNTQAAPIELAIEPSFAPKVESTPVEAQPSGAMAGPSHLYDDRDGLVYSYVAAVSEDDRKKGLVAGHVMSFAYMGVRDGRHVLARIGRGDRIIGYAMCSKPCHVMAYDDGSKVGYDEASIIGVAFTDALSGRLAIAEEDIPDTRLNPAERYRGQTAEASPITTGGHDDRPTSAAPPPDAVETPL